MYIASLNTSNVVWYEQSNKSNLNIAWTSADTTYVNAYIYFDGKKLFPIRTFKKTKMNKTIGPALNSERMVFAGSLLNTKLTSFP